MRHRLDTHHLEPADSWKASCRIEQKIHHALLDDLRTIRVEWLNSKDIEQECDDLLQEMDVVSGMIKAVINENASMEMSQTAYTDRYNALVDRFEKSQSRYDELQNLKERRQIQSDEISGCLFALYELDLLDLEFNDAL